MPSPSRPAPDTRPVRLPARHSAALAALAIATTFAGGSTAFAEGATVCPCLGDIDGNGSVGAEDLAVLLGGWGTCGSCTSCAGDFSGDCKVDALDLGILLGNWGPCSPVPANDHCSDATQIVNWTGSANPFCTFGADTDGPSATCGVPAFTGIDGDVWFRFTAPMDGTVQVGVCADFDVRIAVYSEGFFGGCACPGQLFGAALIGCAGTTSAPSCTLAAPYLVPVTAGDCITLRVGGAPGQRGSGTIDLNFYVPPCEISSNVKLSASGVEAATEFGIAADMSGDVGVAGAIFDDFLFGLDNAGSARVYRYGTNSWAPETTLTSPAPFDFERFGMSVAASGGRIVVGSGTVDAACAADPNCDTGAAYLFEYNGSTWSAPHTLLPNAADADPLDQFGRRVDIDGTRVVVSANDDSNANGSFAGAAYVFERFVILGTPLWLQSAKLLASDGDTFDNFGSDVAVSGAWALVGADHDESGGSAYLFEDTGASWPQRQKLHPSGLGATEDFGYAVAIDGDFAAVGAPDFGTGKGKVYLFERFGALGWLHTATLTAHDGAVGDAFGASVSIADDKLLVGAPNDQAGRGAAYLFWRVTGGWVERAKLVAADGAAGDAFGGSVAIDGGLGLVGAYFDDVGAGVDVGSLYRFHGLFECTGNGVAEACDIAENGVPDADNDGIPDSCEP